MSRFHPVNKPPRLVHRCRQSIVLFITWTSSYSALPVLKSLRSAHPIQPEGWIVYMYHELYADPRRSSSTPLLRRSLSSQRGPYRSSFATAQLQTAFLPSFHETHRAYTVRLSLCLDTPTVARHSWRLTVCDNAFQYRSIAT